MFYSFHFTQDNYLPTTVLSLSGLPDDLYELLMEVFSKYAMAGLKDSKKLSNRQLENQGADCKPSNISDFVQIVDSDCQHNPLQELIDGECSMKEFISECAAIKRRQKTQEQSVRQTNSRSWKNAEKRYPAHTTVNAIDRFTGINFKRAVPEIWNFYVASAKKFKQGQGENTML